MVYKKQYKGYTFIAPATRRKLKKYDVYKDGKYITSFGGLRENGEPYEQYKDKIGFYKAYDHGDKARRDRYRQRHKNDKLNDKGSAGFFSYYFLW